MKPRKASLDSLSALQKRLLEKGLRAYYWMESDLASGARDPGCFGLREGTGTDKETGLPLKIRDHRKRANRRAAAGHAVARLVDRGLVESCGWGKWKLTASGFKAAQGMFPLVKRPTKQEIAGQIGLAKAFESALGPMKRVRPRPRAKTAPASGRTSRSNVVALDRVAPAGEAGIEIEMDF
jgi:hypothetical protein